MSTSQSVTVADSFRRSPEVVAALDAVIKRLESSQASITESRPPVDGAPRRLKGGSPVPRKHAVKGRSIPTSEAASATGCWSSSSMARSNGT